MFAAEHNIGCIACSRLARGHWVSIRSFFLIVFPVSVIL